MSIWRSSKDTTPSEEPINRLLRSMSPAPTLAQPLEVVQPEPPVAAPWETARQPEPAAQVVPAQAPSPAQPASHYGLGSQPEAQANGAAFGRAQAPAAPQPVVIPAAPPPPIGGQRYGGATARPAVADTRDAWAHTEDLARSIVSLADVRAGLRATPAEVLAARVLDAVDGELRALGRYLAEQIGTNPGAGGAHEPAVQEALARMEWLVGALEQPGDDDAALAGVRRALDAIRSIGSR